MTDHTSDGSWSFLADFSEILCELVSLDGDVIEVQFPRDEEPPVPDLYAYREQPAIHNAIVLAPPHQLDAAIARLVRGGPGFERCIKTLATPHYLPPETRSRLPEDIEVWDAPWFFERYWTHYQRPVRYLKRGSVLGSMHAGVAHWLRRRLKDHPTGDEHRAATRYEELVRDVLVYLFHPELTFVGHKVVNEADDREADLLFRIDSNDDNGWGLFRRVPYHANFVVVECKNSKGGLGKDDLRQIKDYVDGSGATPIGILAGRHIRRESLEKALARLSGMRPRPVILVFNDELINAFVDSRWIHFLKFDLRVRELILRGLS